MDGVKDGVLENPKRCKFDPGVLECKGADDASCLTPPQVETARMIYSAAVNPKTKRAINGLERGSELGWTDLGWTASARATGLDQFRFLVFGDPKWDVQKFNFESDIVLAEERNDAINALDPNLEPFISRGGKLISYHGWSDPQIAPAAATQYLRSRGRGVRRQGQGAQILSAVHGARHGTLQRRRRTEHIRHGHGTGAVGRSWHGARADYGDYHTANGDAGSIAAALSVSAGGCLQRDRKHRRRVKLCVSASVNHFPIDDLVVYGVEMRNRQRAHRLDGKRDDLFGVAGPVGIAQLLPYGAKRTQHLRAVEPLPVTMVTEAHSFPTRLAYSHFS